jgi:hypothetical protein
MTLYFSNILKKWKGKKEKEKKAKKLSPQGAGGGRHFKRFKRTFAFGVKKYAIGYKSALYRLFGVYSHIFGIDSVGVFIFFPSLHKF